VLERAAEHASGTRGIAALEKCPVERAAAYRDRRPEKKSWSYRKTMKTLTIDSVTDQEYGCYQGIRRKLP
jgi:hypothetical protein